MMKNDELKNSIRFLGIGQAGANVTQMLEKKGYKTYYINLAKQDLDLISSPNKYHIPNGEGASKNRKKAKKVLSESIEEVLGVIDEQIPEKYIFVVYSLGGGTGAGLGTFLSSVIAENPDKIVCLVVILPSMNESLQARINAYEALTEIVEAKNSLGSIFILDNNQREDKLSINRSFANLFDSFINVANYSSIRGVKNMPDINEGCIYSVVKYENDIPVADEAQLFYHTDNNSESFLDIADWDARIITGVALGCDLSISKNSSK